jgi:NAD(P)H-dependent flavin oxidoreductase YrpB (nitropropane dioxygenase family)
MWPHTNLLNLLDNTHPIIQTSMSGFTRPSLVAAVSNAGTHGSLGCSNSADLTVCHLPAPPVLAGPRRRRARAGTAYASRNIAN